MHSIIIAGHGSSHGRKGNVAPARVGFCFLLLRSVLMSPKNSLPFEMVRLRPLTASLAVALAWNFFTPCAEAASQTSVLSSNQLTSHAQSPAPWATRFAFGLQTYGAHPSRGSTITVQNCNDAGTGSLRAAVASAASGDSLDLSQLSCTISLVTGAIAVAQDDLTISGPGSDTLTIDGGYSSHRYNRVFAHSGSGTIHIDKVTVTGGKYLGSSIAHGGCIYSVGSVELTNSLVTSCLAESHENHYATGAGISARHGVVLVNSVVTNNITNAANTVDGASLGAGIYCGGDFTMKYSTVADNIAAGVPEFSNTGGAAILNGNVYILDSTISGNNAYRHGGLYIRDDTPGAHTTKIINTTISGNYAGAFDAGMTVETPLMLFNTTIALNVAVDSNMGAGLDISDADQPVELESSIIALNSAAGYDSDLRIGSSTTVTGANNLITQVDGTPPADTITACPLLGPLADNGGSTLTHRLLINSPALDAGNNVLSLANDQRGTGHTRVFNGRADIGAFESGGGTPNEIFKSEFESRCR
jgi:hypothetical protein